MKTVSPRSSFHHLRRREARHPTLDLAAQRERGPAHLGEVPARLDAHVHVDAPGARGLRVADELVLVEHLVDRPRATACTSAYDTPGLGVEVHPQLVGVVDVGPAHRPRVEVEAAEVRGPDDVGDVDRAQLVGVATARERRPGPSRSTPGRCGGTRFWKKGSSVAPFGYRFRTVGRSRTPRSAPSPTATKYWARSSFVSPRAGKNTLSGFVTFTVRPETSSSTNGEAAMG